MKVMSSFRFSKFSFHHALLLAMVLSTANGLISRKGISRSDVQVHIHLKSNSSSDRGFESFPTGSSLPDCTHACGACNPCKRVMVSFECSIAESCPVVYRCICKGKYYHVPSN